VDYRPSDPRSRGPQGAATFSPGTATHRITPRRPKARHGESTASGCLIWRAFHRYAGRAFPRPAEDWNGEHGTIAIAHRALLASAGCCFSRPRCHIRLRCRCRRAEELWYRSQSPDLDRQFDTSCWARQKAVFRSGARPPVLARRAGQPDELPRIVPVSGNCHPATRVPWPRNGSRPGVLADVPARVPGSFRLRTPARELRHQLGPRCGPALTSALPMAKGKGTTRTHAPNPGLGRLPSAVLECLV
jgi:hypothetical protein